MCVDYMGVNKACLKDPFPLPHIDQVVDSTLGCKTLYFLDAYSRYHQITMKESDQHVTLFHHPIRIILLCHNAVWSEKHGGYILVLYAQVFRGPHQVDH
jgi:hypothetical protein